MSNEASSDPGGDPGSSSGDDLDLWDLSLDELSAAIDEFEHGGFREARRLVVSARKRAFDSERIVKLCDRVLYCIQQSENAREEAITSLYALMKKLSQESESQRSPDDEVQ